MSRVHQVGRCRNGTQDKHVHCEGRWYLRGRAGQGLCRAERSDCLWWGGTWVWWSRDWVSRGLPAKD